MFIEAQMQCALHKYKIVILEDCPLITDIH